MKPIFGSKLYDFTWFHQILHGRRLLCCTLWWTACQFIHVVIRLHAASRVALAQQICVSKLGDCNGCNDLTVSWYARENIQTIFLRVCEIWRPTSFNMKLSMTGRIQSLEFQQTETTLIATTSFVIYIEYEICTNWSETWRAITSPLQLDTLRGFLVAYVRSADSQVGWNDTEDHCISSICNPGFPK
jgi:hypothetical protein